jgi:hypothetical protein
MFPRPVFSAMVEWSKTNMDKTLLISNLNA